MRAYIKIIECFTSYVRSERTKKDRWWHIGRKRSWREEQMEWKAGRLTGSEQKTDICCLWTCNVISAPTDVQRIRTPEIESDFGAQKERERIKCRLACCESAARVCVCAFERERSRKGDLRWKAKREKKKENSPPLLETVCWCVWLWSVRAYFVCLL